MEVGSNDRSEEKYGVKKNRPSATLSTTNPTWTLGTGKTVSPLPFHACVSFLSAM